MSTISLNEDGTADITISIIGNITQESYLGTFKVKCILSPLEFIKTDRLYRELLGSYSQIAQPTARSNAFALAQLQHRIIHSPPFWINKEIGGGHIVDDNVLAEIIEMSILAEEKYREQKSKEIEEKQEFLRKKIESQAIKKEEDVR